MEPIPELEPDMELIPELEPDMEPIPELEPGSGARVSMELYYNIHVDILIDMRVSKYCQILKVRYRHYTKVDQGQGNIQTM